MTVDRKDDETAGVDSVRRRLLKIGIYSVPAIMFLGRVKVARATNGNGPPFDPHGDHPGFTPPGPPPWKP